MEDEKKTTDYEFIRQIGRIINSGQSQSIVLTGNIFDLFFSSSRDNYLPLLDFALSFWDEPYTNKTFVKVVYCLNEPVRFVNPNDYALVKEAWISMRLGKDKDSRAIARVTRRKFGEEEEKLVKEFDKWLEQTRGNPTLALEFLRQLCIISRTKVEGKAALEKEFLIIIEGADMLIPQGEIARLSEADRKRVAICRDWFLDPEFTTNRDSVILITESRSKLNTEISRLPQLLEVEIPLPNEQERKDFISWFTEKQEADKKPKFWSTQEELASYIAGLTIQALMQLLKDASYSKRTIEPKDVVTKVEEFIKSQIGEDVVEFKKPKHSFDDVVGYKRIKKFILDWLIPRILAGAIAGITVGGAIGVGKTYLFEAVASILGIPVLVLKNIRSMWFGETDVIFERLRRILQVFHRAMIFVDEADTQFGGVGKDIHETERRLTGKIQATMADPLLKGKVVWLLLTARIYLLSEDLLRKGRAGDVIFALTDPEGEDRKEFINWMLKPVIETVDEDLITAVDKETKGYSPADFANLRDDLKVETKVKAEKLGKDEILSVVKNRIPTDISDFRRAQTLHALLKCSDRRLLPEDYENVEEIKKVWREELASLEKMGVLD